ncbi:hypothetical protein KFK09_017624 [Dendrobium nobile]|uniref:Uncharacterized protein n=1 Tax=Dendrobium nobile TaxID=94219 RepID=A0A8T3B2R6_DENNO|nr:hypothetical protein KFK09_017624 [Dendrobium nobile]
MFKIYFHISKIDVLVISHDLVFIYGSDVDILCMFEDLVIWSCFLGLSVLWKVSYFFFAMFVIMGERRSIFGFTLYLVN